MCGAQPNKGLGATTRDDRRRALCANLTMRRSTHPLAHLTMRRSTRPLAHLARSPQDAQSGILAGKRGAGNDTTTHIKPKCAAPRGAWGRLVV